MEKDLTHYLGKSVGVVIDRALGSVHPRHEDIIYRLNYGYLPGTVSGDGAEIDAYIMGVAEVISEFRGVVIAVIKRHDDNEDKLVVAEKGLSFNKEEIEAATWFQEHFFDTEIIMDNN